MKSILESLTAWSSTQPNKIAWTFLDDKGEINETFTYKELERVSLALSNHLINSCGLHVGDRVLLVFFPGLQFTISMLACLKGGIIAVPVFPPDPRKLKKDLHHFVSIQKSSGASTVLSHSSYNFIKKVSDIKNIFASKSEKWPDLRWIEVDDVILKSKSSTATLPSRDPPPLESVAFLQYTSGSTSEPKGVMITHKNLAHNEYLISESLQSNTETVNISWLPQYHDMGLIGSYLGLLYCGGTGYYLSPISFLKDPLVWIRSIAKFRGTHTQAPNFAFALVARKYREYLSESSSLRKPPSDIWDLSSLRHIVNAAEPVDAVTMATFTSTFQPLGLRPDCIVPTYGLAEHTVFVCSGGRQRLQLNKSDLEGGVVTVLSSTSGDGAGSSSSSSATSRSGVWLVGCGFPGSEVDVKIVNADSNEALEENQVGEIWVHSQSKASGYWNQPELSTSEFHATLVRKPSSSTTPTLTNSNTSTTTGGGHDGYLRTGDLGFMYQNELFICGRLKDLIIIRGSNHYPQDIERSVEKSSVGGFLRAGCCASFAVTCAEANAAAAANSNSNSNSNSADGERLVVVVELKEESGHGREQLDNIISICRSTISSDHGLAISSICLLKPRTIRKTTSGKIARSWCKKDYLAASLQVVHRWDSVTSDADNDNITSYTVTEGKADDETRNQNPGVEEPPAEVVLSRVSAEELRSMSHEEVRSRLESALLSIANNAHSQLHSPVDPAATLVSLGLDSMSVVQFKGVLENRFHCTVPDEFLFTSLATLNGLVTVVKNGGMTEEQRRLLENAGTSTAAGADAPGAGDSQQHPQNRVVVVGEHKQPLCPWFTCCY